MRFTPTEAEILLHRLDVADAIADALGADLETVVEACLDLSDRLEAGAAFEPTEWQLRVFRDAADGSTFFAGVDDEMATGRISCGWFLARLRAANSLEQKLGARVPRQ